ncbi:hypothetical protein K469DRAFT_285885 [Zopfia rhizophila CBS 207.26]|uniref:Uncharacterized protein n=1 Tax=Zopfia rhizophila CBS 207.26 TaxID=1314779 RepID=A0A6A6EQY2_9PEZI|nr:hypothetical protein K469DRAFT_285885 [Zopfia rhizophila CBS 207.26]
MADLWAPVFATDIIDFIEGSVGKPFTAPSNQASLPLDIRTALIKELSSIKSQSPTDSAVGGDANVLRQRDQDTTGLVQVLRRWKEDLQKPKPAPRYLIYILNHEVEDPEQYMEEILELGHFEGEELDRALALKRVCEATGFQFFLSNLTRFFKEGEEKEVDICDPYWNEPDSDVEDEVTYELVDISDCDGRRIISSLSVSDEDLVQKRYFEDNGMESEEEASAHVLLLIPNERLVDFLASSIDHSAFSSASDIFAYLLDKAKEDSSNMFYKSGLRNLCVTIIESKENELRGQSSEDSRRYYEDTIIHVAKTCVVTHDVDLFRRALRCFKDGAPVSFFADLRRAFETVPFDAKMMDGLETCIAKYCTFDARFEALSNLFEGEISRETLDRAKPPGLSDWFVAKMEELLETPNVLVRKGFGTLLRFAMIQGGNRYLLDRITPAIENNADKTPLAIIFLNFLWQSDAIFSHATIASVFQRIVPRIRDHYNLVAWERDAFRNYRNGEVTLKSTSYLESTRVRLSPIDGRELASFFDHCLELGLHSDLSSILGKFGSEANILKTDNFAPTILPCLQDLASHLSKRDIPRTTPGYQTLFNNILSLYL